MALPPDVETPPPVMDMPGDRGPNKIPTPKVVFRHEVYSDSHNVPWRQLNLQLVNVSAGSYARTTAMISKSRAKRLLPAIRSEVEILRRLDRHHVVKVCATYSTGNQFAIIMQPVADMNLQEYLAKHDSPEQSSPISSWFGCLDTGLDYLHSKKIK